VKSYVKALNKGILKVISKMGISTIQSYCGAQIFEAVGLDQAFVDQYFTWTATRIGGVGLDVISEECIRRHRVPSGPPDGEPDLEWGGEYQCGATGRTSLQPDTIFKLQYATRTNQYKFFKEYSNLVNDQSARPVPLRGLLEFKLSEQGDPPRGGRAGRVESSRRFGRGAMSLWLDQPGGTRDPGHRHEPVGGVGAIPRGGRDPARFVRDANGDWRRRGPRIRAGGVRAGSA